MFENTKMVFVLVRKWCCASWGAVSFSWVVLVWPLEGSPRRLRRRSNKWNIGSVGVKHLFLISRIIHHLLEYKQYAWWSIHKEYFVKNRKPDLKWCPVSRHSWLHFLLVCADPSPTYLKDACIWSCDQLRNVPLCPKATCCHMLFGAGGIMLELVSNKRKTVCYESKQQWLVSREWSQTKTVKWSR